jgi:succinyl-CoA synthetase alpha subunit
VGKRMGHAGAIGGAPQSTALAKCAALAAAGCVVVDLVTDIGAAVRNCLPGTTGPC